MPVSKSEKNYPYGFIDFEGNLQVNMEINLKEGEKLSLMKEGIAYYKNQNTNHIVYVKKKGSGVEIEETEYVSSLLFNDGFALAVKEHGSLVYIDKDFKEHDLLPKNTQFACNFYFGYAKFKDANGNYGFIDKKGKVVVESKYNWLTSLSSDGLATFEYKESNREVFGIINSKNWKEIEVKKAKNRLTHFKNGATGLLWICEYCEGSGFTGGTTNTCENCQGKPKSYSFIDKNGVDTKLDMDWSYMSKNWNPQHIILPNDNGYIQVFYNKTKATRLFALNQKDQSTQRISSGSGNEYVREFPVVINTDNYFLDTKGKKLYKIKGGEYNEIVSGGINKILDNSTEILPLFGNTIFLKESGYWKFYSLDGQDKYQGKPDLGISEIQLRSLESNVLMRYGSFIHPDRGVENRDINLFVKNLVYEISSITDKDGGKSFEMIKKFYQIDREKELNLLKVYNSETLLWVDWDWSEFSSTYNPVRSTIWNNQIEEFYLSFDSRVIDNEVKIKRSSGLVKIYHPSEKIEDYKIKEAQLKNVSIQISIDSSSAQRFHKELIKGFANQGEFSIIDKKNISSSDLAYRNVFQAIRLINKKGIELYINYHVIW